MIHLRLFIFLVVSVICQFSFAQHGEIFNVKKPSIDTTYKVYFTIKMHDELDKGMVYWYLILFPDGRARTYVSNLSMAKVKFPPFENFVKYARDCNCSNDTIRFSYPRPTYADETMLFLGVVRNKRVDATVQWTSSKTGKSHKIYHQYYPYYGKK